jgi:hypothetical protein
MVNQNNNAFISNYDLAYVINLQNLLSIQLKTNPQFYNDFNLTNTLKI